MSPTNKLLAVLVTVILSISTLMAVAVQTEGENSEEILLVTLEGEDDFDRLIQNDIKVIDVYGDYVLMEVDSESIQDIKDMDFKIDPLTDRTQINVKSYSFDIEKEDLKIPSSLRIDGYPEGTEGGYIVHMLGPVNPEWREVLLDMDVQIVNYIPNYAYHIRTTPDVINDIQSLEFIDWVGLYQPAYKIDENLNPGKVTIELAKGSSIHTAKKIAEMIPVESIYRTTEGIGLRGTYRSDVKLQQIASMPDVYYISHYDEPVLMSEIGSQITGGGCWVFDDDSNPSTPYRAIGSYGGYANQLGYDGTGVTCAIADTGLGDGTTGNAGHVDFTGRVLDGYDFDGTEPLDGHGHGTHCAGLMAGDAYDGSGVTYAGHGPYYVAQGLASNSNIYPVRIFDAGGSWCGPSDYYEILQVAAQNSDAYIHSNSWGESFGDSAYAAHDEAYDKAARDADNTSAGNQPLVIVVAAGNSGSSEQTIGSPSTGKNVIAIGCSQSYMPDATAHGCTDTDVSNPDLIADFSSRGWATDNRVKPDLCAPGEGTLSTSTPELPSSSNLYGLYSEDSTYEWCSGTSQACPTAAGAASVVVNYYESTYGVRPSPSMVKALMINSAHDLDDTGGNTGTIPNKDEGWGLVNLKPIVDSPVPYLLKDQESLLTTGNTDTYTVQYVSGSEPLKVSLVWTDKNALDGDSITLKNDLNLEVEAPDGTTIYSGNAFNATGGTTSDRSYTYSNTNTISDFDGDADGDDDRNNVECVYIQPSELQSGFYTIRVIGEDIPEDANNDGSANQDYSLVAYNAQVDPDLPDLTIFPGDVSVSNSNPNEGDTVTIGATLTNVGTVDDAVGVEVGFYDGNPISGGTLINTVSTTPSTITSNGGTGYGETTWNTAGLAGYHTIYAVADPSNSVAELIESNNTLTIDVTVEGYGIEMTCDPNSGQVLAGGSNVYNVTVENIGTLDDDYHLTVDNPNPGWNAYLSTNDTSVIPSLGTETVQLTVESPPTASPGEYAVIGVDGESNGDPSKTDSISTNTSVQPEILLVNDGAPITNYQTSLDNLGVDYNVGSASSDLSTYKTVIWVCDGTDTLDTNDQSKLSTYLDNGGYLYVNGEDIGYDIGGEAFYTDYLHAVYETDSGGSSPMSGVPGDPITDGMSGYTITGSYPSEISPADASASTIFTYDASGGTAGIKADTGTHKVVYIACEYFEGSDAQTNKDLLMERILNWMEPVTQDIPLTSGGSQGGWNFISTQLIPKDTSTDALLSSIDGNYDKVMSYRSPYEYVTSTAWEDDFETDKGWTFSGGEWEYGAPGGLGGSSGDPDPSSAYSGSNVIGYDLTGDGDYENDLSTTYWATSPVIDLSGYSGINMEFQRWLGVESSSYDHAYIEVYDGSAWQQIWSNGGSMSDGAWTLTEYDVSDHADNNANFQIRFGLGTTDGSVTYCGWNVDDIKLTYSNYQYSEGIDTWRTYVPGRASHYNTLHSCDETEGFWVHMNSDDTLTIEGGMPSSTDILLHPGWNMVGYPSETAGNNGLPTEISKVGYFDASSEYNLVYDHDPGTFNFQPKEGYWLYNDADHSVIWTVDY
ncbi:MAG: S8 family serine peptidase [Thermoplasmata archaeon]